MNKSRNLLNELNIKGYFDSASSALDINVEKIKDRVNCQIDSASTERESRTMKSRKRISLIAVVATLILSITVFAASGIISQWFSSSSSIPDYKTLPSAEQVIKDIGYEVELIEEFENGYTFNNGSIVKNNLADDEGNTVEKFKSVTFRYGKDDDKVLFSQDKFNSIVETNGDVIATINNVDVYYYSYTNKLVPGDYKMTEEDKEAEKSGELVFSYGLDKVEINQVQSVSWEKDGVCCQLLQIDGKLTANELAGMAAEIIVK